ncbi:Ubiquitin carboxyl-terminal hydrolase 17-like protein 17 [Frankliniella fusca]|uniref:Ubiquitin carboxyl-terminal hydrolase 17-like protein 17 n=1 Tax=Frankliniella fusca TaxID=407009 RepID=A0AAE1LEP8_9NEOP|nr:Ubiquitin carboxyl-terminal hydrolase 17-like protein 17 [Frankliniella fusca]
MRRAGFANAGQSCYVGAALQLLLHVEPLVELLAKNVDAGPITSALALLSLQHRSQRVVDPTPLILEMNKLDRDQFPLGEQQDSSEFLDWLLHRLSFECQEFADLFETVLSETVLNDSSSTLDERLENFLQDDSVESYCRTCFENKPKRKSLHVVKPASFLVINVARFQSPFRGVVTKSTMSLRMSDEISLQASKYVLKSFLYHVGANIHGGHYIAVCKEDGHWRKFNDETVTEVVDISDQLFEQNNCVLLFELLETEAVCTPSRSGEKLWTASPLKSKETPKSVFGKTGAGRRLHWGDDDTGKALNNEMAESKKDSCAIDDRVVSSNTRKLRTPLTTYEKCVLGDPDDFHYFTGLTPGEFQVLYDLLGGDEVCSRLKYVVGSNTPLNSRTIKISLKGRLFLVLVRMRRDLTLRDISFVLGLSVPLASAIFKTWVRFISITLQELEEALAVSAEKQNRDKPRCFTPYKNLRIIIDCTEFPIERSSNMQQQSNTFSDYKHGNTAKALIGISCYGGVSYVSECFEGRMSDQEIVIKSGFLKILKPGDVVMADRGFKIEEVLKKQGCKLIKPPEKKRGQTTGFTSRAEVATKSIASVRIYVEHVMGRIKDWSILANRVELLLLPYLGDMVKIAAWLHNFSKCYIGQKKPQNPTDEKKAEDNKKKEEKKKTGKNNLKVENKKKEGQHILR